MPADPLSSQRGLERQEEQGINTATAETDFTVLCLSLWRDSANLFHYFLKSQAKSSCALSGSCQEKHMDKKQVQSLSSWRDWTHATGMCIFSPAVSRGRCTCPRVQENKQLMGSGCRSQLQLPTSKSRVSGWVTVVSRDKQNKGVQPCSHPGKVGWNLRWLRLLPWPTWGRSPGTQRKAELQLLQAASHTGRLKEGLRALHS